MMASLKELFDYQKFAGNSRLEAMIRDTESRYGSKLSIQQKEMLKNKKDHV